MPTINQLVRKPRASKEEKSKSDSRTAKNSEHELLSEKFKITKLFATDWKEAVAKVQAA